MKRAFLMDSLRYLNRQGIASHCCFWMLLGSLFSACATTPEKVPAEETPHYSYQQINAFPHDSNAFTQGLVFADGVLYESTGRYQQSSLRKVILATGEVQQQHDLAAEFFGEGLTIYQNKIIQLTWRAKKGFVYDKASFRVLEEFQYATEGWGLTHNGQYLIMSDGTALLHFLDPFTFEKIGELAVYDQDQPVTRLNELEYIEGEVWANVWQTDFIVRIALQTGQVLGWVNLEGLLPAEAQASSGVLNGIAYDSENQRLFVTGKFWPQLFEIEIFPQ